VATLSRKQADILVQRIMAATDGSGGAERAVDVAAEFAKAFACDLLIVTIADRLSGDELRQLAHTSINVGDVLEAMTTKTLQAAKERACHLTASRISTRTGWGDVTRSLLEIAASNSVDMIVVGRRGRGQLAGLLLGSVSQKLASLAPCPVVVVP
jgi:nucleotide-binding universal stress UspA family protein